MVEGFLTLLDNSDLRLSFDMVSLYHYDATVDQSATVSLLRVGYSIKMCTNLMLVGKCCLSIECFEILDILDAENHMRIRSMEYTRNLCLYCLIHFYKRSDLHKSGAGLILRFFHERVNCDRTLPVRIFSYS